MTNDVADRKTRLFISYARKDGAAVERLYDALSADQDFDLYRDTNDILPAEEWRPRLEEMIRNADSIIYALSPNSVASEECSWELRLAATLNKRIIPVVIAPVTDNVPDIISRLNYIFLTNEAERVAGLAALRSAIRTDIGWLREHTRLADLAYRWERSGRPGAQLLRGQELDTAETWLLEQPHDSQPPSESQRHLIHVSRHAAVRRQRIATGTSLAALVVVGALAGFAWVQRDLAVAMEREAVGNEAAALFELARNHAHTGNPVAAGLASLGALAKRDAAQDQHEPLPDDFRTLMSDILPRIGSERQIPPPVAGDIRVESVSLSSAGRVAGLYRQTDTPNLDGLATVRDIATGAELMRLDLVAPDEGFHALALSPDGRFLAVWPDISDGVLQLHEVDTAQRRQLDLAETPVSAVAFAGDTIVVGGFDGSVRAFDLVSGAELWLHEITGDGDAGAIINEIAASDRQALVLAIADDRTLAILDLASGAMRASFDPGQGILEGASFDPELPRAYFFDRSGAENHIVSFDLTGMTAGARHPAGANAILGKAWGAMLPGVATLAYISGNGELSWSGVENSALRATRALIAPERFGHRNADATLFEFHSVSPDLRQIAFTHRRSGTLSIFELAPPSWPGNLARADDPGAAQIVAALMTHGPAGGMLSSDWHRLLPAAAPVHGDQAAWLVFSAASARGGRFVAAGEALFRFDMTAGQFAPVLSSGSGRISAVAATADEEMVVTGSPDGTVALWNISDGKPMATWPLQHGVEAISVLPDNGGALVMADRLYRLDFATLDATEVETPALTNIRAALYRNDHRFVLTSKSGMWTGPLEAPGLATYIREDRIEAATFLGNSDILAVGTDHGLHLYDAAAAVRIATLAIEDDGYFAAPDFMSFDPSSQTLIVLSDMDLTTFDVSAYAGASWRRALCTALGANLVYPETQRVLSGQGCP